MSGLDHVIKERYISTFGALSMLERIHPATNYPRFLLTALKSTNPSSTNILFQKLKYLSVKDVESNQLLKQSLDQDASKGSFLDYLIAFIIERYEGNAEVEELTLTNCFCLDESEVELLNKVVADVVVWGRHEGRKPNNQTWDDEMKNKSDEFDEFDDYVSGDESDGADLDDIDFDFLSQLWDH